MPAEVGRPARRTQRIFGSLVLLITLTVLDVTAQSNGERSSRIHWHAGATGRRGMSVSISGPSWSGFDDIGSLAPLAHDRTQRLIAPPLPGPNPDAVDQIADRDFDNGFVHRDALTAIDGWTVFWGYRHDDQYDPVAGTLTFQRQEWLPDSAEAFGHRFTRSTSAEMQQDADRGSRFNGLGATLGAEVSLGKQRGGAEMALAVALSVFPEMTHSLRAIPLRQRVTDRYYAVHETLSVIDSVTDTYVFETINPAPPAPYDGSGADPEWDPLIVNVPISASRDVVRETHQGMFYPLRHESTWTAASELFMHMKAEMAQAAVGPRITRQLGSRLRADLGMALVLNYLDWAVERRETLIRTAADGQRTALHTWHDHGRRTDWLWGGKITVGAQIRLHPNFSLGARAGHEWMETRRMSVGPNRVGLDLSATVVDLFAGVTF